MKYLYFLCLILLLHTGNITAQQVDTTREFINYRRTDPNSQPPTSYYQQPKEQVFPLGWNTGTLGKVTSGTGVWTELNPKVPRVDYLGIGFVNKDTGWAVGANGALIKTTDGGASWVTINTPTTSPILKVRSYNGQVVIASGFDGLILRATDTGETFTQVTSGVTGDLWGLQMINDTLGWACGTANSLIKTTDGGESWQTVATPGYTSDYWWIDFLNDSYGFIAANGKVLRTTDGGQNWEIIQAGDSYPLFSIDVIDSLHIAAAGYGGTGYRGKNIYSSDGGYTWVNGGPTTFDPINCIKYISPDTGYITMSEVGLWKTTNRGQEWTLLDSIPFSNIGEYELQFFKEDNIGYNAGSGIKLYKADGNLDEWNRLIINDDFFDVFFTTETTGFALSGALYKTTDGGMNWETVPNAPGGYDILFTDTLTGFIVNNNSSIYKTTDGGVNWYLTNITEDVGDVRRIFFINHTTGWAVTIWSPVSNAKILKTTDGGENWFVQAEDLMTGSFTSIFFVDSLNGWATRLGGRPYKTTDGGNNWIEQTDLDIWESRDVFFKDSLNGFMLESNKFYETTDGGTTWILNPDITGFSVGAKFSYYDNNTIFIIGYNTYRTTDGGKSWQDFPDINGILISGLSLIGPGYGFAVGDKGLILKYNDDSVPVELSSFNGSYISNSIELKWTTETELNNSGFEILRSKDLSNWESIGFVPGRGTTTSRNIYSFYDSHLIGNHFFYKLKQIDFDGSYSFSEIIKVEIQINNYSLSQNYPNPFNPSTTIKYSILKKGEVKLTIYDILGREVAVLVNEVKDPGYYEVNFNASNLASGVYFYRLAAGSFVSTRKMLLLK